MQAERAQDAEACAFAIPHNLPADPLAISVSVFPSGTRIGTDADVSFFDAGGRRLAEDGYLVRPSEIDVTRLVPEDASVDVSQGSGRVPLRHPEAVSSVTCIDASCALDGRDLLVRSERGADEKLEIHMQLRPHVVLRGLAATESAPVVTIPLQRCPVSIASSALIGLADDSHVAVRIEGSCVRGEGELTLSTL
jgi:hypothetical protein